MSQGLEFPLRWPGGPCGACQARAPQCDRYGHAGTVRGRAARAGPTARHRGRGSKGGGNGVLRRHRSQGIGRSRGRRHAALATPHGRNRRALVAPRSYDRHLLQWPRCRLRAVLGLASDIRIAADTVHFTFPEVAFGTPLTWSGIPILAPLIGADRLKRALLLRETIAVEELVRHDLFAALVPAAELPATLDTIVAKLLDMPRLARLMAKRATAAAVARRLHHERLRAVPRLARDRGANPALIRHRQAREGLGECSTPDRNQRVGGHVTSAPIAADSRLGRQRALARIRTRARSMRNVGADRLMQATMAPV